MNKAIKPYLFSAIGAYIIKFLVDAIMYIYMIYEQNDIYYDVWYLFVPQIVSTVMMLGFYVLFLREDFYGVFFKLSTYMMLTTNVMFMLILYFDSTIGYVYYFTLVAAMNFLNALYLKCNIVPTRKPGYIEYIPILFEIIPFVCMVMSLYAVFCSFPTLQVTESFRIWDYYDIITAIKMNLATEVILVFAYALCLLNKCEFIRDSMYVEPEEELDEDFDGSIDEEIL